MEVGAHLPLMDFGGNPYTLDHLVGYVRAADRLGFTMVSANDHLVFAVPWLDGPTALAAVIGASGTMSLATTIALPVVRGPAHLAKTLGAIDRLSGGRLIVAVGPGSSAHDHAIAGLDFDERWKRLDEAIAALRAFWTEDGEGFAGRFYSTAGVALRPYPVQKGGPPIWVGSWGSEAGLRRTARLADGWLASAYNTTPKQFGEAWDRLRGLLPLFDKDPETFPNGLATMWFHLTDDDTEAERVLRERLVPTINRPEDVLRDRLPVGSPERMIEKLVAFGEAGVQRVLIWPVTDEIAQLERFAEQVRPALER